MASEGWTINDWAEIGVRPNGEPMSAEEMASCDPYPDCTCYAPDDAEPEEHDEDCPEKPRNRGMTMNMNEHANDREDLLNLGYHFRNILFDAAAERNKRPGIVNTPHGPVREWMLYEEEQMLTVVNRERSRRSMPPASSEQIRRANSQAEGHCDYVGKFAIYCAEIAMGIERTEY